MTDKIKFPFNVEIIAADNGYIVKVGCSYFAHEGDSQSLTADLQKYLNCDESILKLYDYHGDGDGAFRTSDGEVAARLADKCDDEDKDDRPLSPAFSFITSEKQNQMTKISETFKVTNGVVTIDYRSRKVTVHQRTFDN